MVLFCLFVCLFVTGLQFNISWSSYGFCFTFFISLFFSSSALCAHCVSEKNYLQYSCRRTSFWMKFRPFSRRHIYLMMLYSDYIFTMCVVCVERRTQKIERERESIMEWKWCNILWTQWSTKCLKRKENLLHSCVLVYFEIESKKIHRLYSIHDA